MNRQSQARDAIEVEYQILRLRCSTQQSKDLTQSGVAPRDEYEALADELHYMQKREGLLRKSQKISHRMEMAQLSQLAKAAVQLENKSGRRPK